MHGGYIGATSEGLNKGSIFFFELPCYGRLHSTHSMSIKENIGTTKKFLFSTRNNFARNSHSTQNTKKSKNSNLHNKQQISTRNYLASNSNSIASKHSSNTSSNRKIIKKPSFRSNNNNNNNNFIFELLAKIPSIKNMEKILVSKSSSDDENNNNKSINYFKNKNKASSSQEQNVNHKKNEFTDANTTTFHDDFENEDVFNSAIDAEESSEDGIEDKVEHDNTTHLSLDKFVFSNAKNVKIVNSNSSNNNNNNNNVKSSVNASNNEHNKSNNSIISKHSNFNNNVNDNNDGKIYPEINSHFDDECQIKNKFDFESQENSLYTIIPLKSNNANNVNNNNNNNDDDDVDYDFEAASIYSEIETNRKSNYKNNNSKNNINKKNNNTNNNQNNSNDNDANSKNKILFNLYDGNNDNCHNNNNSNRYKLGNNKVEPYSKTIIINAELIIKNNDVATLSNDNKSKDNIQNVGVVAKKTNFKILLIDDAVIARKMVARSIAIFCNTCHHANNGFEAIKKVSESIEVNDPYDAIVCDYYMPDINGAETIKKIREIGFKKLVFGVTGSVSVEDTDNLKKNGADFVLMKPLNIKEFRKILEKS
jgi:CheY-like chemotaxis protein